MPSKPLLRAATGSLNNHPDGEPLSPKAVREIAALVSQSSTRELLHSDQIIRIDQLREIFPFSRPSIYRLIRAGKFPAPISLGGGRAVGWVRSEVMAFIQKRMEQRDLARTCGEDAAPPQPVNRLNRFKRSVVRP